MQKRKRYGMRNVPGGCRRTSSNVRSTNLLCLAKLEISMTFAFRLPTDLRHFPVIGRDSTVSVLISNGASVSDGKPVMPTMLKSSIITNF